MKESAIQICKREKTESETQQRQLLIFIAIRAALVNA
jgi:hypothetical protein